MTATMSTTWETDLAELLTELSGVQQELLSVVQRKCALLASADIDGLREVGSQEQDLAERLQACQERRKQLLLAARAQGMPSASIRQLATALPAERRGEVMSQIEQAGNRTRLLQHQSLTNWVLVQRTLLHLSQMLEIIATGGRLQPTYEKGQRATVSGSLVDRAA